jgi:amino acid adenylation domain-containing protein
VLSHSSDQYHHGANAGVVGRIAELARTSPDSLAVSAPDGDLSYGALFNRGLELGVRLRAAGVGRGDLVALCVPRSADLVVGALGILVAGGGYVALNPDQPDARLRFMLEDSAASVIVAHADVADRVGCGLSVVSPAARSCVAASGGFTEARHDAVAYAVYTSGSTGQPKGVLLAHAGLLNLIDWHQSTFGITGADRTTLIASPGFDAAVWEIWPCLTAGASLHVPPDEIKTDPIRLRDWLLAERITVCFLPTPLAEVLASIEWPSSTPLRWLLTGGDVLHHRPRPGLPFTLVNNYGVSEATVVSTSTSILPADGGPETAPGIGFPIDGVTLRVVGADGRIVPDGAEGELLICGCSVAVGYLGRPDLTQKRFVADPLDPRVRAYRTGDRVRISAAGSVEFLGRIDDQMQIRGFRVEPGEIVGVVNRHPGVGSCAVAAVEAAAGDYLALFVVAGSGEEIDADRLRGYLAEHLPDQMVPSAIIGVDTLPTTSNGKIDRAALTAIATSQPPAASVGVAGPRTEVETALASIVAELLRLPMVAIDENFFLLGGHSMLGAQLIVRVADLYGVEMTLLTLFDNPTVAKMAIEVERLVTDEISTMSDDALLRATAQLTSATAQQ